RRGVLCGDAVCMARLGTRIDDRLPDRVRDRRGDRHPGSVDAWARGAGLCAAAHAAAPRTARLRNPSRTDVALPGGVRLRPRDALRGDAGTARFAAVRVHTRPVAPGG